jgi:2-keto-4-pentenoate hydratase/2-oxohepta-3-ene-1,7-dioic acid hydratase in catechol pathway
MRLVRFDGGRTGVLTGDEVADAAEALPELCPGADWAPLIADWPNHRAALEALEGGSRAKPLGEVGLEPPLPNPSARIYAMGGNFPMHTAQTAEKLEIELSDEVKSEEKDAPPWGFYVIPGTTVGPEAEISPPNGTQRFDYEAEVAVVLTGEPVSGGDVTIWGYTAWNDFSIRDAAFGLSKVDHGPLTWSLQKNFTSANAAGPWLVVDDGTDYADMRIVCRVNGETRQDGNTREMKYSYGEIAAHISEYLPLMPGDMILSGTPSGTAMEGGPEGRFLQDGDVCEVQAGESGVLRNRIVLPS